MGCCSSQGNHVFQGKVLGQYSQILLPFNCKAEHPEAWIRDLSLIGQVHDQAVVLTVSNYGPGLPDAQGSENCHVIRINVAGGLCISSAKPSLVLRYDSRHKTGRWPQNPACREE